MAPEILTKGETHNEKVDIWAVSVLTYLLLAQKHPFKTNKIVDRQAIKKSDPDYAVFENAASLEAASFVKLGLTKEPDQRPFALQMLQHSWFRVSGIEEEVACLLKDNLAEITQPINASDLENSDQYTAV